MARLATGSMDLRKKGCGLLDLRIAPHLDFVSGVEPVLEGKDFGLDTQLEAILVFGPILLRCANLLPRQELPKILKHLGVRLKARVHPAVQRKVIRSESSEHTALAQERGPGIEQARRNHDVGCDAATRRDWPAVVRVENPWERRRPVRFAQGRPVRFARIPGTRVREPLPEASPNMAAFA